MDDVSIICCPVISMNGKYGVEFNLCFFRIKKEAKRLCEGSNCFLISFRNELLQTLATCGFKYQEFLLSPTCVSSKDPLILFNS